MTSSERRKLTRAVDAYRRTGDQGEVVREVCYLLYTDVPEITARDHLTIFVPSERKGYRLTAGAQPKPAKRHVDPAAITAYKKEHPTCEAPGPDCWGPADFSHLIPRSKSGADSAHNGLTKCRFHHSCWHLYGAVEWLRRFGDRLRPEARMKIEQAIGSPQAAKGAQ